jgi:hypothetical protein
MHRCCSCSRVAASGHRLLDLRDQPGQLRRRKEALPGEHEAISLKYGPC